MKPNKITKNLKNLLLNLFLIILICANSNKSTKTKTKIESDEFDMNTLNNLFGSKYNGGEAFFNSLEQDAKNYPPHTLPKRPENEIKSPLESDDKESEISFLQKEKLNTLRNYENSIRENISKINNDDNDNENNANANRSGNGKEETILDSFSKNNNYNNENQNLYNSRLLKFKQKSQENIEEDSNMSLLKKSNGSGSGLEESKTNKPNNQREEESESEEENAVEYETTGENKEDIIYIKKGLKKGLLWSGYLKINSPLFKQDNLFPPIQTFDSQGNIITIHVKADKLNYRINDLNRFRFHFFNNNKYAIERRDFWFKLNKKFFFYSINPEDVNILQTFPLENMKTIEPIMKKYGVLHKTPIWYFAIIEFRTNYRYQFESSRREHIIKVFCLIKKQLGIYDPTFCYDGPKITVDDVEPDTEITKEEVDVDMILPKRTKFCNENWNYENHGDDWECKCKEGYQQSPINLPKIPDAIDSPVTPMFNFDIIPMLNQKATVDGYIKKNTYTKIKLADNALRILHPNMGKITAMNGSIFIAEEITFHTPSEHTIDGKRFDMEMQVVFYGVSKGDIAKMVILSFLFERKNGYYNRFLDDIDFYNLPSYLIKEKNLSANLFIPKVFYSMTGKDDVDEKLAVLQPFSFYTYEGSLTNPPCSENVVHYIYSTPIPTASVTIDMAKEAIMRRDEKVEKWDFELGIKNYESEIINVENYRNIQDLNNRRVFHYDHTKYFRDYPMIKDDTKEETYHYEKIFTSATEYMFVPGKDPSGIPGSFVIDEKEAKGIIKN